MKILIIGSGGREHAMAYALSQDSQVSQLFVAPGNAGTARLEKCQNITAGNVADYCAFAQQAAVDLTIVGSETLLAKGIVDVFQTAGLAIFGPDQAAAQLEASKAYAKAFMQKYGVKTADYQRFDNAEAALDFLQTADYPLVIKADGLAAGKGVIIAEEKAQAELAIQEIMLDKCFASAGDTVVIEQFLTGVEASILSFTDCQTILPTLSAKDHKKIGEGETGPNTGGMGVIAPNPFVTDAVYQAFVDDILQPTLRGLQAEGFDFAGIIFFGLMINETGVYLLEYNMRLGDPETQAVLPLMNTPLLQVIAAAQNKQLQHLTLDFKAQHSCCVVAASRGYPESPELGEVISGLPNQALGQALNPLDENCLCFVAGAKLVGDVSDGEQLFITSGGRVLNIVGLGADLASARAVAYAQLDKIHFAGKTYRKDIGQI